MTYGQKKIHVNRVSENDISNTHIEEPTPKTPLNVSTFPDLQHGTIAFLIIVVGLYIAPYISAIILGIIMGIFSMDFSPSFQILVNSILIYGCFWHWWSLLTKGDKLEVNKKIGLTSSFSLSKITLYIIILFPLALIVGTAVTTSLAGTPFTFKPDQNQIAVTALKSATGLMLPIYLILITIALPILEEIIFRGILMTSLQQRYGNTVALIISSLAFAVMHMNYSNLPYLFVLGFACGIGYWRTGSLKTAIGIHILNNIFVFGSVLLANNQTGGV